MKTNFDAVVMLTWSNWHTEPRSNRYHYATRFAREVPVIFIQPDLEDDTSRTERLADHNITILHVSRHYTAKQTREMMQAIEALGVRRPLLWIYNVYFEHYIRRAYAPMRIYHATEDYLSPMETLSVAGADVQAPLKRVLQDIDLLVSVSDGVARSYEAYGGYNGPSIVLRNGCDFEFWRDSHAADYGPPEDGASVAFFQGGINSRLDYELLLSLAQQMPDWQFWFCGKAIDAPDEWKKLKQQGNVRDFGLLSPERIAELSKQALVGIIPFKQDSLMRRSLPLKAYEYVACGLPVVSIPIDELAAEPHLFQFATTADEFASAIKKQASTRTDAAKIEERVAAASEQSYDNRFARLKQEVGAALYARQGLQPRGNLLVLYDDRSLHVRTIEEHLVAFRSYSRHNVCFLPATGFIHGLDDSATPVDFSAFDAVAIHYSIRLSISDHLSRAIASAVTAYQGPKLLFIQDEYDATETARQWIEQLGIDAVFTTVPLDSIDAVYPNTRFPNVDFVPTLTGYVPEDKAIDSFARPLEDRHLLIGYRGRRLPHHYGDLGQEKLNIGIEVKRLAEAGSLPVDIEVDDTRRIYGNDWYRFLSSCRATLGTESGSNVFDFDGSLAKKSAEFADIPYEDFKARFLMEHEGKVRMNQISPKIFEAIRLRTALVLFEGGYSGVVQANRHYIPLKKDYSNFDEVVEKLQDLSYLHDMTNRAYREIIESGRYSYASFMRDVDAYLGKRFGGRTKGELIMSPVLGTFVNSGQADDQGGEQVSHLLMTSAVLRKRLTPDNYRFVADNLIRLGEQYPGSNLVNVEPNFRNVVWLASRWVWRSLPQGLRVHAAGSVKKTVRVLRTAGSQSQFVRFAVKLMPNQLRNLVRYYIR